MPFQNSARFEFSRGHFTPHGDPGSFNLINTWIRAYTPVFKPLLTVITKLRADGWRSCLDVDHGLIVRRERESPCKRAREILGFE